MIYIYSMESFLFNKIKKTTRDKNLEKFKFYGPFALAISFIIHSGKKTFADLSKQLTVYRKILQSVEELVQKY